MSAKIAKILNHIRGAQVLQRRKAVLQFPQALRTSFVDRLQLGLRSSKRWFHLCIVNQRLLSHSLRRLLLLVYLLHHRLPIVLFDQFEFIERFLHINDLLAGKSLVISGLSVASCLKSKKV